MRRFWIIPALIALGALGGVLILTADDDVPDPALEEIVTGEGVTTKIPAGWVVSEQFPFDFAPPGENQVFDQWTVARACPIDGCLPRTLDEWSSLAPDLPTFAGIERVAGTDVFNVEVETLDDARILRATTEAAARLVFVAAFTDGADAYLACSVRLGLGTDERLADEIVEVCRTTELRS